MDSLAAPLTATGSVFDLLCKQASLNRLAWVVHTGGLLPQLGHAVSWCTVDADSASRRLQELAARNCTRDSC